MWTSNSVWVGQIIKVPVIDQKGSLTESISERKLSNESSEKTDNNQIIPSAISHAFLCNVVYILGRLDMTFL